MRTPDAVAVLICTHCQFRRYVNRKALDAIETTTEKALALSILTETTSNGVIIEHAPCKARMALLSFPENMPRPLAVDDLQRVMIGNTNARTASDAAFQAWASQFFTVVGEARHWSLEDRVEFCDVVLIQNEHL